MARFLLDPTVAFLNHGSFGATPAEVLDAQDRWRRELEREPVDFLARRLPELLAAARDRAARFVGVDPSAPETDGEVVLTDNSTTGIAAILGSLDARPGDEWLTTDHRYDAVRKALDAAAARAGATVREVALPWPVPGPEAVVEAVVAALGPRTRLLVLDQVTSPTALVLPVAAIARAARERGAAVLVDGAHAPGMLDLAVPRLGADWWVGNLHKWACAPKGTALLWAAPHRRAALHHPVVSHGRGQGMAAEFHWPGTRDPSGWLAAPVALDLHEAMGGAALRRAHRDLALRARRLLAEALDVPLPCPDAMVGAMASLPLDHPAAGAKPLQERLFREHRVEVVVHPWRGRSILRVSAFAAYNRIEDYARLARLLPPLLAAPA